MLRTTLRRLEVFVAVVESGGFRACADLLGISQAAVSSQIKQLESEIGDRVFVRRSGAVGGLTNSGVTAYREAKDLLHHADSLGYLNGKRAMVTHRRLAIWANPILDAQLAKYVTSFIADHPDLDIVLQQSRFEDIIEGISAGAADIAYFYTSGPIAELRSDLAWLEPLSICASEHHPVVSGGPVSFSDLAKYQFVVPPRQSHFRRSVDQIFRARGIGDYPIVLEAAHVNIAREAVISGLGVSGVITRYLNEELSRYGVKRVDVDDPHFFIEVRRAVRRDLIFDDTVLALTHYLDVNTRPLGH